jgi:hypothetical protein
MRNAQTPMLANAYTLHSQTLSRRTRPSGHRLLLVPLLAAAVAAAAAAAARSGCCCCQQQQQQTVCPSIVCCHGERRFAPAQEHAPVALAMGVVAGAAASASDGAVHTAMDRAVPPSAIVT